jgi:hypothetical protein
MTEQVQETANGSPVLAIWRRPGRTVAALTAAGEGHAGALLVVALFGALNARRWLLVEEEGGGIAVDWAAAVVLPLAAVAGLVLLAFYAWLYRNFGRWLGGGGSLRAVRTGMGWGLLPATAVLALAFFFPSSTWLTVAVGPEGEQVAAFSAWGYLLFAALAYAYGVFLVSAAAAHRLSVLRAFAALAIAFLVSIIPLSILVQALAAA